MTHDIRELTDEKDLNRALEVFFTSMVGMNLPTSTDSILDFVEAGRPLGLFRPGPDGTDELVGTAGSFSSRLTVPGGARLPMAAVTDVGVLPTHTRRGLAGALIRRQLEQTAERGEPVATLRASEATIYERFGYGIATETATVEVDVARARLRPTLPAAAADGASDRAGDGAGEAVAPVRFVDARSSWDLLARIAGAAAATAGAGAIERPRLWWRGMESGAQQRTDPMYAVVHGAPGAEDGYLRYHSTSAGHWFTSTDRAVVVDDLIAHTPQAYRALLRFLLSLDLLHRIVFDRLPVDHPLQRLVLDERAVRTTAIRDETWLRLIDVHTALSARTYRGPATVTIGVSDPDLPANTGSYLVSAAGVERTSAAPELSLGVAALATAYLSGTRWWQLAEAGRVQEHAAGALEQAEELFGTARAPYAGVMF